MLFELRRVARYFAVSVAGARLSQPGGRGECEGRCCSGWASPNGIVRLYEPSRLRVARLRPEKRFTYQTAVAGPVPAHLVSAPVP